MRSGELLGRKAGQGLGGTERSSALGCSLSVPGCSLTPGGQSEGFGRRDPEHLAICNARKSYNKLHLCLQVVGLPRLG